MDESPLLKFREKVPFMMLKNRMLLRAVLLLTACSLFACAAARPLTAERPKAEAFRTALKMEPSTLNIPVETTTDDLARLLNRSVRTELYKGSTGTRGVTADVVRSEPIVVTAADDYLFITLPVTLLLSYGMFETPTIPLRMKFRVKATITPDWRLHADISYQGLSDLLAEDVRIGLFSFNPRSIVEDVTRPVQKVLSDLIAQKINDAFPLKKEIAKIWNEVQKPLLLDKDYSAWLTLTPQDVMLYPLSARNNRVRLSVGIRTYAELVVGPEPPPRPLRPLPDLTQAAAFDKSFRIALNADLFYKELRGIASTRLLNRTFDSDGKSIRIKELDLYGNGDRLVVKLETLGALEGTFYLTARPVFNPQTNMFSVQDVDFDMQTENMLHKSADWFLHGTIRSVIQEKLNLDLTARLEQTRLMAGKALDRIQLLEHVFLKGNIKNLTFNDVIVQQDKISIRIYSDGESAILFQ